MTIEKQAAEVKKVGSESGMIIDPITLPIDSTFGNTCKS